MENPSTDQAARESGGESRLPRDLARLLQIDVPVIVKLAEKKMKLEAITSLSVGAIIEFEKEADEELELMIRNKAIGFGKAVKIGENFGLRVTSMVDVRETLEAMASSGRGGLIDPEDLIENEATPGA